MAIARSVIPTRLSIVSVFRICALCPAQYPIDLLRVIRKGPAVKSTVDNAIDQCAQVLNLRDSIEESRSRAEQATDDRQRRQYAHKGWSFVNKRWLYIA